MCRRRKSDGGTNLHIVRPDCEFTAVKFFYTVYLENIAAGSCYVCTHARKHITEILDVRFASRIRNYRGAFCKNGGHDCIFSCSDRHFIEEYIGAEELVCRKYKFSINVNTGSELCECKKVCVESAPSNDITAGWKHFC